MTFATVNYFLIIVYNACAYEKSSTKGKIYVIWLILLKQLLKDDKY